MRMFAGLDVGFKRTLVCIVDQDVKLVKDFCQYSSSSSSAACINFTITVHMDVACCLVKMR